MTLTIKVLGNNCSRCQVVEQHVHAALALLEKEAQQLEAMVIKVTDFDQISQYPVLSTPALVVNEQVLASGRIPSTKEIANWLRAMAAQ